MLLTKNDIQVNGIDFTQYLVQIDFEYNKLWANDTGRNLAGKQTGTLIGIFPKLVMQFRKLNQEELHIVAQELDKPRQMLRYYDDDKAQYITIETYTGDWKIANKGIRKNEGFSCSFIATERRS